MNGISALLRNIEADNNVHSMNFEVIDVAIYGKSDKNINFSTELREYCGVGFTAGPPTGKYKFEFSRLGN
jgi:hypothetical protein